MEILLLPLALVIAFHVLWFTICLLFPLRGTANVGRRTEVPTDRRD